MSITELIMKTHPFKPILFENSRKMIIGTLPPESAPFYFSNSSNTRLWDILYSISTYKTEISKGSIFLADQEKKQILKSLSIAIYDIIFKYDRSDYSSTRDKHIIPFEYSELTRIIENTNIDELIFVYKNAAKWFLHSLTGEDPVTSNKLKYKLDYGVFTVQNVNDREVSCSLLPSPLNRGKKGENLKFKLEYYRRQIQMK